MVTKRGRGSRTTSDRPPPGAVNLERSYEICRAVIQNSPNRHQLKAQLRPPPSMLAKNVQVTSSATAQGTTVTKFIKKLPDEQTPAKTNKVVIKVNTNFHTKISIQVDCWQINFSLHELFGDNLLFFVFTPNLQFDENKL